ncbi:MAG: SDR family oxidoreductase [Deltaproteobacteria bacterium]|nr:SDR family oxidoreductase [Deltaproteobacteria bacterium]
MPRRVAEQVVVVTGASSGIGRAVARAFGAKGARVGLIARNAEALEHAAEEIVQAGGEAMPLPLDVADASEVDRAADAVVGRWGRLDTWVNDAMVSVFSPVKQMRPEEYRRVTEVTYLGTVHGTLAALRHMLPRDQGTILQIGSALAYRSIPLQSAYCAAKAAIRGFTDSLRSELIHDRSRVKVSMLQLPAVNTPQFDVVRSRLPRHPQPIPPIFQPEVVAQAVLRVAEKPVREMWIAGSAWKAILGQRTIPGFLDEYLAVEGYRAQQTDELMAPEHPDNLDAPLPGDRGAHGDFDARARSRSLQLWARLHAGALAASAAALVLAAGLGTRAALR